MEIITSRGNPDDFFARLETSVRRVLLLDYDGTLAPFRAERDQAFPWPGVRGVLDAIAARDRTRLVIISGRSIGDLLPLLGMRRTPELWGCHGWERLQADGRHEAGEISSQLEQVFARASAWANAHGLGEHLERKPASVALHWRGLDDHARTRIRSAGESSLMHLAREGGLELHEFDGGLELRLPGRNKGEAVRRLLAEEDAGAVFACLGDDLTDEDAFNVLSGRGLNVLVRRKWRPTAADLWLKPPDELLDFLNRWSGCTAAHA